MANNNNSTNLNNSSETMIVYICIHLVMPSAVAIGIIGNLLSILVFARREMIKFCVSIFTIVLALSDILLLTTSLFNIILPDFLGGLLSDKSAFWWYVMILKSFISILLICFFFLSASDNYQLSDISGLFYGKVSKLLKQCLTSERKEDLS